MREPERNAKLKQFSGDVAMQEAVRWLLDQSFRKRRADRDVHVLAATALANDFLDEAWLRLLEYKNKEENKEDGTPTYL